MKSQAFLRISSLLARSVATLAVTFSLIVSPFSLAQPVHAANLDVGLTSFYTSADLQEKKVETLKNLGYEVAVPLNIKDLAGKLGNGSFQSADLDFSTSVPSIPGTAKRIPFEAPVGESGKLSQLYAVVAGIPDETTCPVEVKQTKIVFFKDEKEASDTAEKISKDGFIVYVTGNKSVQDQAKTKIKELNCNPTAEGVIVNGKTKAVSVDFTRVWPLLPSSLQMPAKTSLFEYTPPSNSDAIYLVNGRKKSA